MEVMPLPIPALAVRRYWYVFYKTTGCPAGAREADEIPCRLATLADIPSFGSFRAYRSPATLSAWIREPTTWLFVAFDGERPIAYDCVSRELPAYPPFSRLALAPDAVWVRDIYTVPEYRRRYVMRSLRVYRNTMLREWGFRATVSGVAENNAASLVSTYDGVVQRVDGLDYRRILCVRSIRLETDVRAKLEQLLDALCRRRPRRTLYPP